VCNEELLSSPGYCCDISRVTLLCESAQKTQKTNKKKKQGQRKQEKNAATIHVPVTYPRKAAMTRGIFNRRYHVSRLGCF